MKTKTDIQAQLKLFCLGGLVAALLILSIHYTKFDHNNLQHLLPVNNGSHTINVENGITVKKLDQDPLAELLKTAAMEDNTVILTQANEAWMSPNSLFDIFLESFHVGEGIQHLLDHLIVVTVDQKGFEKCQSMHKYCYFLKSEKKDLASEKPYMSKDYIDMMWARNKFQRRILELGFNFLFTDMDILWFRNPLRHIAITSHFAFASDFFYGSEDNIEISTPNGGFMYVKSSNKTIKFYKSWYKQRYNYPDQHEQFVLNKIKVDFSKRFKVRMQFLNSVYCAGFCEMSKDITKVCTVHANCCVGISAKLQDLRGIMEDWKKYKAIPPWVKERDSFKFREHGMCLHPTGK